MHTDSWEKEQNICVSYETNCTQRSPSEPSTCSAARPAIYDFLAIQFYGWTLKIRSPLRPDRLWGPPSLVSTEGSFPGSKTAGGCN
jgi:hypothetical protein